YYVLTSPKDMVLNISSNRINFEKQFNKLLYQNNIISDFLRNALLKDAKDYIFFMVPPTKDFKSIIQHLFSEFVQKDSYSESLFYYYLQIFYVNILRSIQNTCQYYASEEKNTAQILLPAILQYMDDHYRSITLDELAERFHYESSYLSRFIKASTGKNYIKIITELKIREAKKLLTDTNLSIAEIALQTGYHSADHFTCSFKQQCGLSPTAFRKASHTSQNGKSCQNIPAPHCQPSPSTPAFHPD
ncbi:MAG: AraC family transcriptional regulator, partial [Lachnospiraceae bacterium]|nr:AraC family transcriptional regulator [Lachnospiraceae bacterium]